MDDFLAGGGARGHQFALRRYEGGEGEGEDGGEDGGRAENAGPVIAPPPSNAVTRVVRYGDGGATLERDDDDALQQHPFFDGLREAPKEAEWDVETILSTYTTTDNHPSLVARPVRAKQIRLHPKTGLPLGVQLPAAAERAQNALTAARLAELADGAGHGGGGGGGGGGGSDDDDDGWSQAPVNAGAARGRGETAAEKRERKAAAKAQRQDRRAEKKATKLAFGAEKQRQLESDRRTRGLPGATSLSGPGS